MRSLSTVLGAGVLAYLAAWILIPAEGEPNSMAGVPREGLKAPSPLWSGPCSPRNCCEAAREIMTTSPGTQVSLLAEAAEHGIRFLPPARYRHPGDVIRLILGSRPSSARWRDRDSGWVHQTHCGVLVELAADSPAPARQPHSRRCERGPPAREPSRGPAHPRPL